MKVSAEKVYDLLKKIPKGKIITYKQIANQLKTKAYRGIGQIISKNPNAPQVPCHRVVKADGLVSGYAFGVDKKIALLKVEGIEVKAGKVVDFKEKLYRF
jgi:methylated-DNA-[protein]-cysteine S-methyltransferase